MEKHPGREIVTERHSPELDIKRTMVVSVPAHEFMGLLCDFERYPDFISDVISVSVKAVGEVSWQVTYTVSLFRRHLTYTLEMKKEDHYRLSWKLVGGEWLEQNEGYWHLEPLDAVSTRANYALNLTFKRLFPQNISDLLVDALTWKVLRDFKEQAEALAPTLV
jgi:ribosome-associated toxin RatA of RatAB toxin-antitoxin module